MFSVRSFNSQKIFVRRYFLFDVAYLLIFQVFFFVMVLGLPSNKEDSLINALQLRVLELFWDLCGFEIDENQRELKSVCMLLCKNELMTSL